MPHDGTGGAERLSGEICLTLTVRTPLIVGNERYAAKDAEGWRPASANDEQGTLGAGLGGRCIARGRQVLEPLRLPDEHGSVVIPGPSLKGMLRSALGALTGAPMERVGERHYTYRPNARWCDPPRRIDPCPAIVLDVRDGLPTEVDVFEAKKAEFDGSASMLRYRGGMEARLAGTADPQHYGLTKRWLHAAADPHGVPIARNAKIDDVVRQAWRRTAAVLADDKRGHLHGAHPDLHKAAKRDLATRHLRTVCQSPDFQIGDMIYVEWDTHSNRIVAFGHHYYFRWAYNDSVRRVWDNGAGGLVDRPQVSPTADEKRTSHPGGPPVSLTGARRLFGYAVDKTNHGVKGIAGNDGGEGDNDWSQLAGRLAFNAAVEVIAAGKADEASRFLNPSGRAGDFCVSLPQMGLPKSSAVEFYLDQSSAAPRNGTAGSLVTYGDLVHEVGGKAVARDRGGDLAGRKVYLHQPNAAGDDYAGDISAGTLLDEHAPIVRFVSRRNTQFRVKLRFAELEESELALVLDALDFGESSAAEPKHGHKLGYARPLGFGSVVISVDAVRVVRAVSGVADAALPASFELANFARSDAARTGTHWDRFKALHRLDGAPRDVAAKSGPYPTEEGAPNGPAAVLRFHNSVRQKHLRDRRG
ncbi:MAG: hypothetical protein FJ102_21370 [Deltaproteobacteria bacterium]|nr:hypothetical protein [Deltaproteobacteria bacterium]